MRTRVCFSKTFCQDVMRHKVPLPFLAAELRELRDSPAAGTPIAINKPAYRQLLLQVGKQHYNLNYIYLHEFSELECSSLTPASSNPLLRQTDRLLLGARLLGLFMRQVVEGFLDG